VIDTHCHLTFPDFAGRVPSVLEIAQAKGVTGAITISTTTTDCLTALAIARAYPNVWSTSGIHPLHAHEGPHDWANLALCIADPKCVAWGELGLDNHYTDPAKDIQHAVLHEHLAFIKASGVNKPIVLHCREAFADLVPILKASGLDTTKMVFHCFTGTLADARLALDLGSFMSFTGVATYKNAADVRAAARLVPKNRIMIETDAPFLPPEPHRGTRPCEPWMASLTAARLAAERGESLPRFLEQINANTTAFFGIVVPPHQPSKPHA
jgi:TatD DNase family protein